MEKSSLIPIIVRIINMENHGATWVKNNQSRSHNPYVIPCQDMEIASFIREITIEGANVSYLTIGEIKWEDYGIDGEDEMYESYAKATRLPDGRLYIEIFYDSDKKEEYIYNP